MLCIASKYFIGRTLKGFRSSKEAVSLSFTTSEEDLDCRELRMADSEAIAATKFAMQGFHKIEDYTGNNTIWRIPYPQIRQLAPQFHLFARKFGSDTAKALLDLFDRTNEGGERLGIFGGTKVRDPELETNFKQLVTGH